MSFGIAAAGTGGHVFPALAVGEALVAKGVDRGQVHYFGGDRLEASVFPAAGFPFHQVKLRGLQRPMTIGNLGLPWVMARSVQELRRVMRQAGVKVILGMGGYATPPVILAARTLGLSAAVAEQNAEAGLGNKIAIKLGAVGFGAFPETAGMKGARWVGNPVRAGLSVFDRAVLRPQALAHYGLRPDTPVLGVFGGSLGAGAINEAVAGLVKTWTGDPIQVLHLVGERFADSLESGDSADHVTWRIVGFEPRMELFYAASDLVVARAGGAVAELSATGTPAILVPGVFGSGHHQVENARVFSDHGAAVVMPQEDLFRLSSEAKRLLSDHSALTELRANLASLARPDAAAVIASEMQARHG